MPGPVDSAASSGTNALIREGAILVRSVEDVLEELDGIRTTPAASVPSAAPPPVASVPVGLDDTQRRLWELLAEHRGISMS